MTFLPGISHPSSKFTEDDIRLMRAAHTEYQRLKKELEELAPKRMAKKFEISNSVYWEIVSYQSYKNVL